VVSWETKRANYTKQQQLVFNHPESLKLLFATPDMTLLRYEALKISHKKCTKQNILALFQKRVPRQNKLDSSLFGWFRGN